MDQHVVHTCCAHNCGGRAVLQCTVRDGRLVRVEPGMHPYGALYRGLCALFELAGLGVQRGPLEVPDEEGGRTGTGPLRASHVG